MKTALITVEIPPFREESLWLWGMENLPEFGPIDLVGISDREQFGQGEFEAGTAHLLNVFSDPETDWTRRELTEFSVKTYVYLSKLHRRDSYDRFVVADCAGVEPLIVANLSVLGPVHVVDPGDSLEGLENRGERLLELAERRFDRDALFETVTPGEWPPSGEAVRTVFDELLR